MDRFPLYTKGVERYRFEYAVFLLNKNIDIVSLSSGRVREILGIRSHMTDTYLQMMQDANIRLVDARHTLPNLKALLLTLSSPELPPPPTIPTRKSSGNSTYVNTRATTRQTSFQFPLAMTRGTSSVGSSVGRSPRTSLGHHLESPFATGTAARKSMLGRGSLAEKDDLADEAVTVSSMRDDESNY